MIMIDKSHIRFDHSGFDHSVFDGIDTSTGTIALCLLSGKQGEKSPSIRMRECRRMRDEGRA